MQDAALPDSAGFDIDAAEARRLRAEFPGLPRVWFWAMSISLVADSCNLVRELMRGASAAVALLALSCVTLAVVAALALRGSSARPTAKARITFTERGVDLQRRDATPRFVPFTRIRSVRLLGEGMWIFSRPWGFAIVVVPRRALANEGAVMRYFADHLVGTRALVPPPGSLTTIVNTARHA